MRPNRQEARLSVSLLAGVLTVGLYFLVASAGFAQNDPPQAFDQAVGTPKNSSIDVVLLYTDDGVPGPPVFYLKREANDGSVIETSPGVFTYTPNPGFTGVDWFKWQVDDGELKSSWAKATVTVNAPPKAYDTSTDTTQGTPVTVKLRGWDDRYPGPFSVTVIRQPDQGTIEETRLGQFLYTPNGQESGNDSFEWELNDGMSVSNVATASILVNQAPLATDQNVTTNAGIPLTVTLDYEDDGLPGPLEIIITNQSDWGTWIEQSFGVYTYTPQPGFDGATDSISWQLDDGADKSPIAKVSIYVNEIPGVFPKDIYTDKDTSVGFELTYGDDGYPGPHIFQIQSGPANGTLVDLGNGSFDYSPTSGWSGYDSFEYAVNDGMGQSQWARVDLTVNQIPIASDQAADILMNTSSTTTLDYTDDGIPGPYVVAIERNPYEGSLIKEGPGIYTYVPPVGWTGCDSYRWSVDDGRKKSNWGTVEVCMDDLPAITISQSSFEFFEYVGGSPVSGQIELTNSGGWTLDWSAADLSGLGAVVEPGAGSLLRDESQIVEIRIDPAGLVAGAHVGTIELDAPDLDGEPTLVAFDLELRDPDEDQPGDNRIGVGSFLPPLPVQSLARFARYRPYDGETVTLNPPRFSWPYAPEIIDSGDNYLADNLYTLQISASSDFDIIDVEVADTDCNFYNFLPSLDENTPWYWRVGYNVGSGEERWSNTQSFTIASGSPIWDRSDFESLLDLPLGHPRLFFNESNLDEIIALKDVDPDSTFVFNRVIADADAVLLKDWYLDFPTDDCPGGMPNPADNCTYDYWELGLGLSKLAFAYKLTGDPIYDGFYDRMLTVASWPTGGLSSPEGANPSDNKRPNHITHYLALVYDWFHDDFDAAQRAVILDSLEWRIDQTLNDWSWKKIDINQEEIVGFNSVSMIGWSHEYEAMWPMLIGSLAVYDELPVAREAVLVGLQFLIGITNSYGEDEAWNEGPGYGNDKMQYMLEATVALETIFPELDLAKNEMYDRYLDFFARITPIGAMKSSFGNRGYNEWDWTRNRVDNALLVARLTGNEQAMLNHESSVSFLNEIGRTLQTPFSPWAHYVMPAYWSKPLSTPETTYSKLFEREGWMTVSTAPPSDFEAQKDAVSMTFMSRPRGAYGHSFGSDNAFDIYAYGETIAVGGGTTDNGMMFPIHSMSHNTVLVNGNSQISSEYEDYVFNTENGFDLDETNPIRGRIIAHEEGYAGGVDYVYWAGNATRTYSPEIGLDRFVRHVLFVDNAYFVIYDDLKMDDGLNATFQWLYHVTPGTETPLSVDAEASSFSYTVGGTDVVVQQIHDPASLAILARQGDEGQLNIAKCGLDPAPGTCEEDFRGEDPGGALDAHHIWVVTDAPSPERAFLAVIVPSKAGEDDLPVIVADPLSDKKVSVTFRGVTTSISFDPMVDADLVVEPEAIIFRDLVE